MKILFKLTSRSRPDNFFRAIDSIVGNVESTDFIINCTLDSDDYVMNNQAVIDRMVSYELGIILAVYWGNSKNKIHAINKDCDGDWDILVNVSDDQVFTVKGFDNIIRANMPEDLDGYLHFTDTNHPKPDSLCTLSILGRKYYERDGYIYHPSYVSVWCDNESMEVAKRRGKYKFINEVIFDHRHPAYGKAERDAQYDRTESKQVHARDKRNFLMRQRKGFPA